MRSFHRQLDLQALSEKKSLLFFGPRGTGKTTLLKAQFADRCVFLDLLKSSLYTELLGNPGLLESIISAFPRKAPLVIIDEIQRVPALLSEVHRLIEEKKLRFLLTGSSARKLKREGADMLAGRAWRVELWPLTTAEIPEFELHKALRYGTLPGTWRSESPEDDLDAYVSTYLKEEIEVECRLRNLAAFSRFLKVAALSAGQLINFAQMASDAAIAETTVKAHFQILKDTLIGWTMEPFVETRKRKAIATAKFYLFDNGVRHTLLRTEQLDRNSDLYGTSFESFIISELRAYLSYRRIKKDLTFWRSTSKFEVDCLVGDKVAIEVKSTDRLSERHLRGLSALAEEGIFQDFYAISHDSVPRTVDIGSKRKATLLPWNEFLSRLWAGAII